MVRKADVTNEALRKDPLPRTISDTTVRYEETNSLLRHSLYDELVYDPLFKYKRPDKNGLFLI